MTRKLPPSPKATSHFVTKIMKANKAKDTKPELMARKYLWHAGFKGYRINYKKIPGSPDICFVVKKIAIFVHGCFWHRCQKCSKSLPKTNSEFWEKKFELNVFRDKQKIDFLENASWKVFVLWECELKKNIEITMSPLLTALKSN